MAFSCQSMAIPRPQFVDRLAVLLRFGFSIFQADWIA